MGSGSINPPPKDTTWSPRIVLSHYQAGPLLAAHREGQTTFSTSPDLGLSQVKVMLEEGGARYPGGELATWDGLTEVTGATVSCFSLDEDGSLRKIQSFSEETGRFYSLMPTRGAPTMLLSGIPMHRIKGIDPRQDTLLKIQSVKPVVGAVLDTSMGLGYTAIEAAHTAATVITVELDPAVPRLAAQNPWSRELFTNPKITRVIGDTYDVIETLPDDAFHRVLHDPPAFSLAGDLYSGEFYRRLYRVMRHNARLFHYIGDLDSPSGSRTAKGVARRLEDAGFRSIKYMYRVFGLIAIKPARE